MRKSVVMIGFCSVGFFCLLVALLLVLVGEAIFLDRYIVSEITPLLIVCWIALCTGAFFLCIGGIFAVILTKEAEQKDDDSASAGDIEAATQAVAG